MKINLMLLILAMTIFMALGAVQQKKREGGVPLRSLTDTTDSIGKCGTAERDSVEFENLPYYDNNDYLEALLDSLDYPPDQTLNRSGGISPMNYANYPTRYWIPVKFWIIRNSSGGQGATENDIKQMLQSVNNDFRNNNTLIQFYQKCDIGYIDNNAYLDLSDSEARSLARDNEDAGAVNVFLGHVLDDNAGGIHYANGPISFDPYKAIFLSRPAYQWAYNVMTHELGHYFDLDHTHQFNDKGRCRREPVSRTRKYALISFCKPLGSRTMCESTGDALRDTPADPDLRDNSSCSNYNLGGVDHFGDAYSSNPPLLDNFMSYNRSICRGAFTRLQVAVMLNAIERNMFHVSNRVAWSNASSMFDTYEPDNNAATAGNIIRCEVQERNFHMQRNSGISFSSCDADWVRYVALANETVDVYTSAVSGRATVNTSLFIYDSANNLIVSNDDKAIGDIYSRVSLTTTASTTYFIKIVNNSSTSGGFYKLGIGVDVGNFTISGVSGFCSTTTYSIPNLPAGATVTWNASPAGWVNLSPSGNSVNISPTAYDYGNVTLNAAITTECGVINVTKTIFLGQYPPGDIWGFIGGGDACANSSSNAGITGNYSSYEWTVSGGTILSGQGTSEIRYRVDPYNSASTSFYITCQLRDYCGRSILESPIEYATIVECGPGGGGENTSRLIVYPNPSSEELKIKYPITNDKVEAKSASYTLLKVRLLNEKGKSLKEIEVNPNGKDIILPVANVPNGIYYLHIQEGKKVIKQQVIIAH